MNKFGVHGLVWSGSWGAKECEYAISSTKEAGYDIIELPAFEPAEMDIAAIQKALEAQRAGGDLLAGARLRQRHQQRGPGVGGARRADAQRRPLDGSATSAARTSAASSSAPLAPTWRCPRRRAARTRRRSSPAWPRRPRPRASRVGLEFVNRYESNLLNTSAQTVEYIKETGSDNLVVHLDSYHMNIEENNFRDPVFDAGDLLGYVHIGENHRGYLGQGHVNFPELFKALVDAEYDGVITFESFSSKVVDENLTTILRIWRNMWDNSMDLAVQARRFMGEEMAKAGKG